MESNGKKKLKFKFSIGYLILAFWGLMLGQQLLTAGSSGNDLSYSDFKKAVVAARVDEVSIGPTTIRGRLKPEAAPAAAGAPVAGDTPAGRSQRAGVAQSFNTVRVEDPGLLSELEREGVRVTGVSESGLARDLLSWLLPIGLLLVFGGIITRRLGQGGQNGAMAIGRSKAKVYVEKDVAVTFADAAGVDEAKVELREVVEFLKTPAKFARLGAQIPKGILLVGPPGTGKTLLARAVAGEAGVPFFSISGSDFVEMFVGVGAARVRDLFEQAKQKAPCIVFIDELDALGKVRGVGPVTHEEREQTLNQLLVELDGFDTRVGVILMAATNRPEILDPALLRAGRFDRQVLVDRPDKSARLAILKVHAAKVTLDPTADMGVIAAMTAGFAGADLANIVNEAALLGVRRQLDKVGVAELQEAVERVVAGLEKKNRVLSVREKQRVAHHEVGHALVAMSLPGLDPVHKISIIPRGVAALGYTMQLPTEDRFLMTESELKDKIAMLLGGRAAEELVFDEASTGAHDDLTRATDIARSMVKTFGMSPRMGLISFERDRRSMLVNAPEPSSRGDYSEETAREIDVEVRRIVDEQIERVAKLLRARKEVLLSAARVLSAQETITGEELRALMAAGEELDDAGDHAERGDPGAHDDTDDSESPRPASNGAALGHVGA